MWITRTSINQPVFTTMVMLGLLVLGVFSYILLPVEQMPDVQSPIVSIEIEYPGAPPESIESDVIKPIENVVNTVNGVKRIYATARDSVGWMQLELRLDANVDVASQEIRDKVALVKPTFPREVKDPLVTRSNADPNQQPILNITVYADNMGLREISTLTEQVIVKRLQNVPGVGNVQVNGAVVRQIQILLKPAQMQSYGIGVNEVIRAIQAANMDLPAGSITSGDTEHLVRVEGRIKDPTEFGRVIVATRGSPLYLQQGGIPVYLDQVADIIDGEEEETSIARVDGKRSVGLRIFKVQNANLVATGEGVKDAVEDLKKRLPDGVHIETIWSNAEWIKGSLDRVKLTIVEGALLTIFIVFLFLHSWRSTIITGLTLPISVIATFIVLHALGFTLNFITLMALSLCIGLLIDDAIVVRENIVRHLNMGKSHRQAALEATEEIGLAVMATTFAIVAVFVPVAFMSGIVGRYFFQFGITVTVAVMVSLFVSFTLDPMLSSVWRDPAKDRFKYLPWLGRVMEYIESWVERAHEVYGRLLDSALRDTRRRAWFPLFGLTHALRTLNWREIGTISNRGIVLWMAAFAFFGSFFLVPMIGTEFIPQDDEEFIMLRINTPLGSSLEYTEAKTRQVEAALREGFPEVRMMDTEIGTEEGKNYARIAMPLTKAATGRRPQKELEEEVRKRVAKIAGVEMSVGFDKPIFISILGPSYDELKRISVDLMAQMAKIPGIVDLESSEKGANPTIAIRINDDLASDLGLTTADIGTALRPLIAGDQISHWLGPDNQDYDVVVQLPKGGRRFASDLGDLYMASNRLNADGSPLLVPLRQIVDFVDSGTAVQLKRLNLENRVSLYAGAEGRPAGDVGSDVEKLMKDYKLPAGYRFDVAGEQEDMKEAMNALLAALGLAVIFIYLILASQFASFIQPIAIMASLPMSLAGVFLALLLTGTTLNLFSMIGFIMLMGLVTKNAILLVDFTNHGLRAGKGLREALLEAGQVRLRPILMTTFAMIFGMMPMSLGVGEGGDLMAPMGRAVIGGLITSTLLTLVVVPVLFSFLHPIGEWAKARLRGADHDEHGAPAHKPVAHSPRKD